MVAKVVDFYPVASSLRDYGVCRATTAEYKALMLSDFVNSTGEFLILYRGHALHLLVIGKRIAPGVYSLRLEQWKEKRDNVDSKMGKCQ